MRDQTRYVLPLERPACAPAVAEPPSPELEGSTGVMTQPTDHEQQRQALITGLMELAAFYTAHPEAPLPPYPNFNHCVLGEDDEAGTAEVEAIAAALGVEVEHGGHVTAEGSFAGIKFRAYYVTRERAADYMRRQAFIAYARTDVPALVAEVERLARRCAVRFEETEQLRAEVERLRRLLGEFEPAQVGTTNIGTPKPRAAIRRPPR